MRGTSSRELIRAERSRTGRLRELVELSSWMVDNDDEHLVLAMVAEHLPALCGCVLDRAFLLRNQHLDSWSARAGRDDEALAGRLMALDGGSGVLELPGRAWVMACALRSLGGPVGYLVVSAEREPRDDQQFLLHGLSAAIGAALGSAGMHHRYAQVSEALARAANQGGGSVQAIARALHELTGRSVIVQDRLAWPREEPQPGTAPVRDGDLLLAMAAPHGAGWGALAMVDAERTATPYELFALEQAAMVLSMELSHRQRMLGVQHALERDLVDDLLAGLDDGAAIARGEVLGYDLGRPRCVMLVGCQDAGGEALLRAVQSVAAELRLDALVSSHDGGAVLLVDPRPTATDGERWLDLQRRIAGALGSPSVAVGVGGLARTPSELTRSHREAAQALAIRSASRVPFGVTRFDELGVYRILAGGESRRDVETFVAEWLGPLIDDDAARGGDMVPTLAAYCESGGNHERTARALHIHRSTLRYRLQRIRELSGRDLNDVDARFNLHVATRAWRVLWCAEFPDGRL